MELRYLTPPPSLAKYVSNIVLLREDHLRGEWTIPLVAKGSPSIVFQLTGNSLSRSSFSLPHLALYGQNVHPFEFYASGELLMIAYFLHPALLGHLFRTSAAEMTHLCIDLSMQQPASQMNLKEQLLNAPSLTHRLQLMNRYVGILTGNLSLEMNDTARFAIQLIHQSHGLRPIQVLQKELRITERSLQRLFGDHVGVTPKTFSRICQFQRAFQQAGSSQFSRLGDVAFNNGYADQNHFIRTFREFTGYSPREYLRRSAAFAE
jgi:AraC-like DNA-binding protein